MNATLSPQILIVTTKADITADYVILKLENSNAHFYRINTEDFPLSATSTIRVKCGASSQEWTWTFSENKRAALEDVRCIWFRRHRLPVMPKELSKAHVEYCLRESDWFLRGLLYSREVAWMSSPKSIQVAESKINQLFVARSLGFRIPDTIVSNDPIEIRAFFTQKEGNVVAKPLRLGYFDYGAHQTSVFTTRVEEVDLQDDESIRIAPVIYQELISKLCDIRVTIVDKQLFAVAIDSQSIPAARIDWRQTDAAELPHSVHVLPEDMIRACLKLVEVLGLKFGALDFVLTPQGDYVFLEINPNGQWTWIEDRLGLPISDSIAGWLVAHSRG